VAAGFNHCDYCASAHTEAGRARGVEPQELHTNLSGQSGNRKTQAALDFVREILMTRGHVSEDSVQEMRDAGYTEAEIVEVIAHVGMSNFTNYFNHIAATEIDFPLVTTVKRDIR
jgi:AhpD family alkylhydroperoxidase